MLVLSRKKNEGVLIGDNIELSVVEIRGNQVRLGITAPKEIRVHRSEVAQRINKEGPGALAPAGQGHEAPSLTHQPKQPCTGRCRAAQPQQKGDHN